MNKFSFRILASVAGFAVTAFVLRDTGLAGAMVGGGLIGVLGYAIGGRVDVVRELKAKGHRSGAEKSQSGALGDMHHDGGPLSISMDDRVKYHGDL